MTQREQLFAKIKSQRESGERLPLVSLEEFFEGNDDYSSIGCNLDMPSAPSAPAASGWFQRMLSAKPAKQVAPSGPHWPHPGPQGFYQILRTIRERPDVQDVLVEISNADVSEGDWPFSEWVYVLTAASFEDVEAWAACIFPTEVSESYSGEKPVLAPDLLPGYQAYALWWD